MPKGSKRMTEPSSTPLKKSKQNQGSDIETHDHKDQFGNNPLHDAIIKKTGTNTSFKWLIKRYGINIPGYFQLSPLQLAVKAQNLTLVTTCLTIGADLNHKNLAGQTAVHLSMCHENDGRAAGKILQLLLSNKADVNATDCRGQTPLHYACGRSQWIGFIRQLLENGAHTSAKDNDGHTPLQVALNEHRRHATAATLLLMHGVEDDLNACNAEGNTFLHHAVVGSVTMLTLQLITTLVTKGANISAQNAFGKTPLHLACDEKNEDICIAHTLLEAGAFNDVDVQDRRGRTPVHVAATNRKPQSCQLLYTMLNKYWGSIDIMDIDGDTPLDLAIEDTDNCRQKWFIFEEHVFKLKCINRVPRLWYTFDFSLLDSKIPTTKAQYLQEIETMKSIKSGRHTFFDIFSNRHDPVHFNNLKLVKKYKSIITSSNFTKRFPIFGEQAMKTYYECESRLMLLNKAQECMTQPGLYELRRMVLVYLSNRDLKNVIQAFSV